MLTLDRSWRAKNTPNIFSKYLKYRTCTISLNYILRIINQNILALLRTFLDPQKNYRKIYTKQTYTAATTEFLSNIFNRKKKSNEHFNLCEVEISLDEIITSINSETNNKSPVNDNLTGEFYKHFLDELAPALLDVYDS